MSKKLGITTKNNDYSDFSSSFDEIRSDISEHRTNVVYRQKGYQPLFAAAPDSKIIIVGQAPGIKAQTSGVPWDDKSGQNLMRWLGVSEAQFRNTSLFAHIPMDFYYPGKGKSGDLPPRKDFADLWHKQLTDLMSEVQMTILIGRYAQKYYLKEKRLRTLTETVRSYEDYLPNYFPLVHPSPLNFRWFMKNDWFEQELVPVLQQTVAKIIESQRLADQ